MSGKHRGARRPAWWRLRSAYDSTRAELEALRRRYEALEADQAELIGDLEERRQPRPEPVRQTSWGRANQDAEVTQPLPRGLAPEQASALTHRTGLLRTPGGAWPTGDRGTTG